MTGPLIGLPLILLGLVIAILAVVFVVVPVLRGLGWAIGGFFSGIGWLLGHLFEFIFGVLGDAVRLIGCVPVWAIFITLALLNVIIGRWSASGHFMAAANREVKIAGMCIYRIVLRRPLKLLWLHGMLEGFEQRVPQALGEVPGSDRPSKRTGQFDGYTIVGSLRGGGSGGKLYIAEPTAAKRAAIPNIPDRVVIKSFALADGSSLPQIVRESRALECAKSLGHVIEHGMDAQRFHYVMPYIPGDHLGVVARELHAISDSAGGLKGPPLRDAMKYVSDLLASLSAFHRGGFWHKDVKPENIIINDGRAHLVDLGLVTALRSAMTLTTHGTEYFRDPEMVRQALRGVKVHQVDGAKFDVFAAGAVLYFLLENTFPAHGGLSAFQKKSPEALHWIVRRAMADYTQRYTSADAMLADLHYVATQADPWKVKPAELPSMAGRPVSSVPPVDPPLPHEAVGVSGYRGSPHAPGEFGFAAAAPTAAYQDYGDESRATSGARPRLRVTNWWTGEYEVDDPGAAAGVAAAGSSFARAVAAVRRSVRVPGRRAGEQVASARARAQDIRSRARSGRTARAASLASPAERQPAPGLVAAGLIVLAALGILIFNLRGSGDEGRGARIMIVNSHALPNNPAVQQRLDEVLSEYRDRGYDVFEADEVINARFDGLLRTFWQGGSNEGRARLEEDLSNHHLYGVIHLRGNGPRDVRADLVHSIRPDARDRRTDPGRDLASEVFIINDYPQRNADTLNRDVRRHLQTIIRDASAFKQDARQADAIRGDVENAVLGDDDARGRIDEFLRRRGERALVWVRDARDGDGFMTLVHIRRDLQDGGVGAARRTAIPVPELPAPNLSEGRMLIVNNHGGLGSERLTRLSMQAESFYTARGFTIVDDTATAGRVQYIVNRLPVNADPARSETLLDLMATESIDAVLIFESGERPEDVRYQLVEHAIETAGRQ